MRRIELIAVKPVGKLVNVWGGFGGLFSAVKNTWFEGVYKNRGLYEVLQSFVRGFIHLRNRVFMPVIRVFIPTIHTTYNKLQLIILNTLLLIPRRIYEA